MNTKEEILDGLNEEQKTVVKNYNGMISLEAIPGSGKTHTMVSRIQYMIKDGVRPSRILAFTFTKKAANELKERVRLAVGPEADKITIGTYHSFCGKLLRKFPGYSGRNSNFSIYDEEDKMSVITDIVKGFVQSPRPNIVAKYISDFKMKGYSPGETRYIKHETGYSRICSIIYEVYENTMIGLNAFDFDDLPFWAYRTLKFDNEVLKYVTGLYDYILSDENQDANKQNLDFIMLLGSRTKNILVVGDTDQSIYAFRGADVNNVINTYKKCHFDMHFLSTNYRSTKTIVRAADCVISHNKGRVDKDSETINEDGAKIIVKPLHDIRCEATYVVDKIKQLMAENLDLKYKDFAILSRMTSQTKAMEYEFLKQNIPYNIKGSTMFSAREEIKDIVAYLRFMENPQDLIAFSRIFNVPKRGLGKTSLNKTLLKRELFRAIINEEDSVDSLGLGNKATKAAETFFNVIKGIKKKVENKTLVSDIITDLIKEIKYYDYLQDKYHDESAEDGSTYFRKQQNIKDLIDLAKTYGNDFEGFISANALEDTSIQAEDGKDTENRINVMTIHGAKGLEFNTVFIIGCTDSNLPHFMSSGTPQGIEEERRLFYVAMTRAKKKLYLTYPKIVCVLGFGTARRENESRFLKEIPAEYLFREK